MSVAELVNTSASIWTGTSVDEYGDIVDAAVPAVQGLPVFLAETGRQVQDPASQTPRTIREITAIVPDWTGVTNLNRILDEQTGDIYIVIGISRPPTLTGAPTDLYLSLKRITAATA